jgi:hypothetical protein
LTVQTRREDTAADPQGKKPTARPALHLPHPAYKSENNLVGISDADLSAVRRMVEEQHAIPAVIVEAILERLAVAEAGHTHRLR